MAEPIKTLGEYRSQIDVIDEQLIRCLAARFQVVLQIRELKLQTSAPVFQPARFDDALTHYLETGRKAGLDDAFLRQLFVLIHAESCHIQQQAGADDTH